MKDIPINFKVNISMMNNFIDVRISDVSVADVQYAYYLYYYPNQKTAKKTVVETKYMNSKEYKFSVSESGYYFVKCFVKHDESKYIKDSDTVLYINNELRDEFENLMSKNLETKNTINESIDYFKVPRPHNDFCLVSSNQHIDNLSDFEERCKDNGFQSKNISKKHWNTENILVFDASGLQDGLNNNYIFSGYAWHNEKFFFGQSTIDQKISPNRLYDCIGNFSLLNIEPNQIKITTDYFGYSKVFYYKDNNFLIVSNRYHLLLIILNYLKIKCELDEEIVLVTFASNVTLLRQTFTDNLTVKNTFMLNLCDEIVINECGWEFVKRPINIILDSKQEFDSEYYSKLLDEGKNDIIDNIQAVYNSKLFKDIVVDLSGGKDSRVNYAALTNIPNAREIFAIRSDVHEPRDLEIAIGINNIFNFKYYTKGDTWYKNNTLDYIKKKRSYFCGYHYLWYFEEKHSYNLDKIRVTGESFESLVVRYYSDTVRNLGLENADAEKLVEEYSTLLSKQAVIDYSSVSSIFKKYLLNSIKKIPSETSLEAFDNLFLFYRGGTHAGNLDRMYYSSAHCMPLQSKSLLQAKKLWINNFKENKIIYDLIDLLNPLISCLPFNSDKQNEAKKRAFHTLQFSDIRFKECKINLDQSDEKWKQAKDEYERNTTVIVNKDDENILKNLSNIPTIVYDNCLLGLQKLSKYKNEKYKEKLCLPLYYYIKSELSDNDEIRILHNKISSILDCIDLIE